MKESASQEAFTAIKEEGMSNIILENWIPQKELFAHEKTKLFITSGGGNSILEALYMGGIPMFCFG